MRQFRLRSNCQTFSIGLGLCCVLAFSVASTAQATPQASQTGAAINSDAAAPKNSSQTGNQQKQALRLSTDLSAPKASPDAASAAELNAAKFLFSAQLRGEDPERAARAQAAAALLRVQALQAESARLQQENQASKNALVQPRPFNFSYTWVMSLAGALLLTLVGWGLAVWHLHAIKKSGYDQWQRALSDDRGLQRETSGGGFSHSGATFFSTNGGHRLDTAYDTFDTNFSQTTTQLVASELDSVLEADVYMSYGRDVQAEEILKEALRIHPDSLLILVKYLEICANRKDMIEVEKLTDRLFGLTGGEGEHWQRVQAIVEALGAQSTLGSMSEDTAVAQVAALAAEAHAEVPDLADEQEPLGTVVQHDKTMRPLGDILQSNIDENPVTSEKVAPVMAADFATGDVLDPTPQNTYSSPDSVMQNKLDLIFAYQEIGDQKGALELIEEVIQNGTPSQIEAARAIQLKFS